MGVVYLAHDHERNTRVALKALRMLNADSVLRFKTEFRSLQGLEHPNLVSLGELVEDKGCWFFTMEYVDGVSFLEYVRPTHHLQNTTSFPSQDEPFPPAPRASTNSTGHGPSSSGRDPLGGEGRRNSLSTARGGLEAHLETRSGRDPLGGEGRRNSLSTARGGLEAHLETRSGRDPLGGEGRRNSLSTARGGLEAHLETAEGRRTSLSTAREGLEAPLETAAGLLETRRLRVAMAQLVSGLKALHRASKVHRDIKPSNIMITREGRVVLLDFGLVVEMRRSDDPQSDVHVVGTTAYMAPEQAASRPVGPPADWYSMGVILYEALTGQLPFDGAPLEVLMKKQSERPEPPMTVAEGVPGELNDLCMDLLAIDPAARPDGEAILERLHVESSTVRKLPKAPIDRGAVSGLIGRSREMSVLTRAFGDVSGGGSVTTYVRGDSGVGKTALVQHFVELVAADSRNTVLKGRCYERESVHYKAVDGVVDSLARYMSRLPAADAAALLPLRVGLLADVFPVLRRVEVVAQAPREPTGQLDPHEVRRRVFMAFRELLARLGDRQRLVIVVEDLHWADADSLALLSELMRPPEAPRLLLVATTRNESGEFSPSVAGADVLAGMQGDVRHLELEPLGTEASAELVQHLLRELGSPDNEIDIDAVTAETGGHPLFIDELVRHIVSSGGSRFGQQRFEDALWARISDLEPSARRLLDLVAVAGAPTRQEVLSRSASLAQADYSKRVAVLRAAKLVRTSGSRATDLIEPYHDRVRDAVTSYLADDKRLVVHRRLAIALEAVPEADPEALARHWDGAGEADKAARYAHKAGEAAYDALAFERAARMFRWSTELAAPREEIAETLYTRLGDALSSCGQAVDAAEAYLRAAETASPDAALELERSAGEQLLRAGHIDRGLEVIRRPMQDIGVRIARTPRRALLGLATRRAQLRLRGLRYRRRSEDRVPAALLRKIDSSWSIAVGLGIVDTLRGADMATRNLLWSLKAGEPRRLARAMAVEAAYVASQGPKARARADDLLERASVMADSIDDSYARGMVALMRGINLFGRLEAKEAIAQCVLADDVFREHCPRATWERSNARLFIVWSHVILGNLREASSLLAVASREAHDRGDVYSVASLRSGIPNQLWLAEDRPDIARRQATEAMRGWSQKGFHLQHTYDQLAHGHIQLYEGDVTDIHRRLENEWSLLEDSMLLKVRFLEQSQRYLRGRVLAQMAFQNEGGDPARFVAGAEADARRLEDLGGPWGEGTSLTLRGALAELEGQTDDAIRLLTAAEEQFKAAGMKLMGNCARFRRSELMGGIAGKALGKDVAPYFESQGVKDPARMARIFFPGRR